MQAESNVLDTKLPDPMQSKISMVFEDELKEIASTTNYALSQEKSQRKSRKTKKRKDLELEEMDPELREEILEYEKNKFNKRAKIEDNYYSVGLDEGKYSNFLSEAQLTDMNYNYHLKEMFIESLKAFIPLVPNKYDEHQFNLLDEFTDLIKKISAMSSNTNLE